FFFFSSRRRHTRSYGDWSSDVCSSDLARSSEGWPRHGSAVPSEGRRSEAANAALGLGKLVDLDELGLGNGQDGELGDAHATLDEIGRASCRERVKSAVGERVSKEKERE